MNDLLSASARNDCGRHDTALQALGLRTQSSDGIWRCREDGGGIFLSAMTLRPGIDSSAVGMVLADLVARRSPPVVVRDSFSDLDLTPFGMEMAPPEPWYARAAGPPPDDPIPADFAIRSVVSEDSLDIWHGVEWAGFEMAPRVEPIYPARLLNEPRFYYFLGLFQDEPAAVATAFVDRDVVGIYDVATLPAMRGRGFASALTQQALSLAPLRPATLQPSEMAEAMYRRLGFTEIGRFRLWISAGHSIGNKS
jgi:GNAT superfamily N-acetyltransferase